MTDVDRPGQRKSAAEKWDGAHYAAFDEVVVVTVVVVVVVVVVAVLLV